MYTIEPHDYLFDQYAIIDDAGQVIYQGLTFRQAVAVWKRLNKRPVAAHASYLGDELRTVIDG